MKLLLNFLLSAFFLLFITSCTGSSDSQAREVLVDFIDAASDGDLDYGRNYACGDMRDSYITDALKFVAITSPIIIEAEANGEGDYSTLTNNAMETFEKKRHDFLVRSFKGSKICEDVKSFPKHEDECKMIDVILPNGSTTVAVILKTNDGWKVSTGFNKLSMNKKLDDTFFNSYIKNEGRYESSTLYDLDVDITWDILEGIINNSN